MAPLHSLGDGLRIKYRCHQKEGDDLRPQHLRYIKKLEIHTCINTNFTSTKSIEAVAILNFCFYVLQVRDLKECQGDKG